MRHFASPAFWQTYDSLPERVRERADKNYALLKENPKHPSLHFKKIADYWSVRVGKVEGGLKQELDLRRSEIIGFKEEQETTYKTLLEEIETLLPGATNAGLATAYRELKESFNSPIKQNSKLFYSALAGIFIAALVLITDKIGFWYIDFVDTADPLELFNNILYKLPIMLPLLWLAIFSSKRRSEDRRLQQEYAHKEAIAKSYQSFKIQVEDLKIEDDALMKKLLDKVITAIAFNASTTLDGKHGDKLPLEKLVEKTVSAVMKQLNKNK